MAESQRRAQLIETALRLFYRHGFHATGIDKLLAEAGIAKMTLYKHFGSKDALILACLAERDRLFRAWFESEIDRRGKTGRDRLLAVFDILEAWFKSRDFHGCIFINAAAEHAPAADPVHQAASAHKREVRRILERVAVEAGAGSPALIAGQIHMLMEGATVLAQVAGEIGAAAEGRRAAAALIDAALAD
ncbi:MAG: TetR/AcrR family transcriptional regulator [Alphaproteobacteria bacterium]|nr:TetR/AcrR family transcriptional regulator [Alphaproteobacteria bacterium]